MTATHVHALMLRCALPLALLCAPLDVALAESKPGHTQRKRAKKKRVIKPETRHDPTALDRRLLPAPMFGPVEAPVGGLVVEEAHWNPFKPDAAKHFTINGGRNAGLRAGDRLMVWRGAAQTIVAEVEVVSLRDEQAHIRVVRQPDPAKILPLDVEAVLTGDRLSLLMRAPESIWPVKAKKKRRVRRIVRKKSQPSNAQIAAEAAPLPPGKDTIIIGGRELPKAGDSGVRLTPAQLPEVSSEGGGKPAPQP